MTKDGLVPGSRTRAAGRWTKSNDFQLPALIRPGDLVRIVVDGAQDQHGIVQSVHVVSDTLLYEVVLPYSKTTSLHEEADLSLDKGENGVEVRVMRPLVEWILNYPVEWTHSGVGDRLALWIDLFFEWLYARDFVVLDANDIPGAFDSLVEYALEKDDAVSYEIATMRSASMREIPMRGATE